MHTKRYIVVCLSFLFPFLLILLLGNLSPAAASTSSQSTNKIDDELQAFLEQTEPETVVRFIIHLNHKADLSEASLASDKEARRVEVVNRLQAAAAFSQASVTNQLNRLQDSGQVFTYTSLWVVNALVVEGQAAAITALANRDDIQTITLDEQQQYLTPQITNAFSHTNGSAWGIDQVQAPQVWYGLGVTGENVTIAIMDSGVDWLHPDLQANYRGNLGGGPVDHQDHWFDAVEGTTEPVDPNSHGTHVAGSAVGQNGIGVAPGANWIGVRMLAADGVGYPSQIHAAFQWILAPDGDPALAPDIVNMSWSNADPYYDFFVEDIEALVAAQIIPVAAAGNNGPSGMTIGAPANYTDTVTIGASDDQDRVAWFSSRGPSPLTNVQKPWIVAPGTAILSSIPGGEYGLKSGTSMATPHVSGAAALLLSANPTLSLAQINSLLRQSATAIVPNHPTNEAGWGRLNAYKATTTQLNNGSLLGFVVDQYGAPLAQVPITITNAAGMGMSFQTRAAGAFSANLISGTYSLSVNAFGYAPQTTTGIVIYPATVTTRNIVVTRLPYENVTGQVVADSGGQSIAAATVQVEGTPVQATTDGNGQYQLELPAGQYDLTVYRVGYRLGRATITVDLTGMVQQDFSLEASPTILMVNDGGWTFGGYDQLYQDSLHDADYHFDYLSIVDPIGDVPTVDQLAPYDVVMWASPSYSPNFLDAGDVISDYLGLGGNLFIHGQNIAKIDSGGLYYHPWWSQLLHARWTHIVYPPITVDGVMGTPFAGQHFSLNGPDSANNQVAMDGFRPAEHALSEVALLYDGAVGGGLLSGRCDPYQVTYFGFGLEGVSGADNRADLVQAGMDWLMTPPAQVGVVLEPNETVDGLVVPGQTYSYTIYVHNISETVTDTFALSTENAIWPTSLVTSTLTLGPCTMGKTVLNITVPNNLPHNTQHTMQFKATSGNNSAIQRQVIYQHKTPDQILFVDDDRWYQQENDLMSALDTTGITYDVWRTDETNYGLGSPSSVLLNAYDMIIWYTGYDWFEPITDQEAEDLYTYMAQGGRLFLTSQDYLYYHADDPLTSAFLGVHDYWEDAEPSLLMASPTTPWSGLLGTVPLHYAPYQNFSDGLFPQTNSQITHWGNSGLVGAIATPGDDWRSVFWAVPFEVMTNTVQAQAMNHIVGWLGDLGDSTFVVDERTVAAGLTRYLYDYAPELGGGTNQSGGDDEYIAN